jgi:hypothetical protein
MDNAHLKQLISELRALLIRELEVLDAIDLVLPTNPNTTSATTTAVDDTHTSLPNRRDSANNASLFQARIVLVIELRFTNKVHRLFNRTPTR